MYNKLFFICFLFLSDFYTAIGQDINYAKQTISTLCSNKYHGRGYTNNGVKKASKFIFSELKKNNNNSSKYEFQRFRMPVSAITNLGNLKIDTTILKSGKEYIIHPNSKSCDGKYSIVKTDKTNFKEILTQNLNNSFITIDTSLTNDKTLKAIVENIIHENTLHAKGVINLVNRNTMQTQDNKPISWVSMEIPIYSFPANAAFIEINFASKQIDKYKTRNVFAIIPGSSDSIIAFTAHYDHIGELGDAVFCGANDNASGVAMILDLYKTFCKEKPKYTIAFIFFTGEEIGLVGSQYFVSHPLIPLSRIKFLLNMDILGSGEDGITIVNSTVFNKEYELLKTINEEKKYLPKIKTRGASNNSDHAPFYNAGVKSFFIYSQGKTGPYHNPEDTPENLSLGKYTEIVNLLIDFVNKL